MWRLVIGKSAVPSGLLYLVGALTLSNSGQMTAGDFMLREGDIAVSSSISNRRYSVAVRKIWPGKGEPKSYEDFLNERFAKARILSLQIPGSTCYWLIVDGRIEPVILEAGRWEVWEIDGLSKDIRTVTGIMPEQRKLTFVRNEADLTKSWCFDFSHKSLEITYSEEGGW